MHRNNTRENREIPCSPLEVKRAVSGSQEVCADDERAREVGQKGSTREVPEQSWNANGCGRDGGKTSGQGELGSAKHLPDSRPERMQSALGRVRQIAVRDKKLKFTSLMHHIASTDTLREAGFPVR
jgi:hypothetical protein